MLDLHLNKFAEEGLPDKRACYYPDPNREYLPLCLKRSILLIVTSVRAITRVSQTYVRLLGNKKMSTASAVGQRKIENVETNFYADIVCCIVVCSKWILWNTSVKTQ